MKLVHTSTWPAEAYLLKGYLETAGIPAIVQGGELVGLQGALPLTETRPSLWVADADHEQATLLVREFLRSRPALDGATLWRCPTCGEYLEPQFTDCWQCGTSRVTDPPQE